MKPTYATRRKRGVKPHKRSRPVGVEKAIRIQREADDRDARMMEGLASFGALYGIHPGSDMLVSLDRMAKDHERQADAHQAAAALIRETIAAAHSKTLRPPMFALGENG